MSIEITCIECGARNRINDRLAGRHVRCPQCDQVVPVPPFDETTDQDSNGSDVDEAETETVLPADSPPTAAANRVTENARPSPEASTGPLEKGPLKTGPLETGSLNAGPLETGSWDVDEALPTPIVAAVPIAESSDRIASASLEPVDESDRIDFVSRRLRLDEDESDMTPMVDVTFLLLIFFMVTAAFSLQKAIEMPRQQSETPSSVVEDRELVDRETVEVQIDEYGSFLVLAPEFVRETPGKQNLITALRDALEGSTDAMRLHVKVHELAKLHSLVDATDAGAIAGYSELVVTQVEQFE